MSYSVKSGVHSYPHKGQQDPGACLPVLGFYLFEVICYIIGTVVLQIYKSDYVTLLPKARHSSFPHKSLPLYDIQDHSSWQSHLLTGFISCRLPCATPQPRNNRLFALSLTTHHFRPWFLSTFFFLL